MGSSSGALIPHLKLGHCHCFKFLRSVKPLQFHLRRPKLGYGGLRSRRRFGGFVCSAVDDDVREKNQEVGGGIGSAIVEDRLGQKFTGENKGSPSFLKKKMPVKRNMGIIAATGRKRSSEAAENFENDDGQSPIYNFLYPSKELLPDDKDMSLFDHLEELRQRIFVSVLAVGGAIMGCFAFSKELIKILEAPVKEQGVRFLQLAPGEFFFTTIKVSGYCGLLVGSPVILYEIIAFVLPGLTRAERRFLGPIVLGSSVLFYAGIAFSYLVLTPAALNFFVSYAEGAVESLWSIDQYFEFVLVLMFSTGLSFQVPVIQFLLGQLGLVTGDQMLSVWRYVVVGAVVAAAIVTPSTDPLTQVLLAAPLLGLYFGGAWMVKITAR